MGVRTLSPHFVKGSILEVGCADGGMTRMLLEFSADYTVLDGAEQYLAAAMALSPKVKGELSLIEVWTPGRRYDNIILAHVLEHVQDPLVVLARLAAALAPGGRLLIIVPNANSLHRLAGVEIGLLQHTTDLNETDLAIGHRRVYTAESLATDIESAGLISIAAGGIFLKPLPNAQIEEQWEVDQIEAYYRLGASFPTLCGELYAVCQGFSA
jgi:2-polyprenyl-3-methyl-5-hydroxy-6-metoxy-1,4-benzoquinol methylase